MSKLHDKCIVEGCSSEAVNSHSFPDFFYKEIKNISTGSFVFYDENKPYKQTNVLQRPPLTYMLCNYHDNNVLSKFENRFKLDFLSYRDSFYDSKINDILFLKNNSEKVRALAQDISSGKRISDEDEILYENFRRMAIQEDSISFNTEFLIKFSASIIWKHFHQKHKLSNLIIPDSHLKTMERFIFCNGDIGKMDLYISHIFFNKREESFSQLSPKNIDANSFSFFANGFRFVFIIDNSLTHPDDQFLISKSDYKKIRNVYCTLSQEAYEIKANQSKSDVKSAIDRITP